MQIQKTWIRNASVLLAINVMIGAFAAHWLKKNVSPDIVYSIQTGVNYQYYHSFALLFLALLNAKISSQKTNWIAFLFQLGIVLFSFSIYFLNGVKIISPNHKIIPFIAFLTPFGGLCFVGAWGLLAYTIMIKKKD